MNLSALKSALDRHGDLPLRFVLPDGRLIPAQFHVTEAGHVTKRFIDCGGAARRSATVQLQLWLGSDREHRLTSAKLAKILRLAGAVLPGDDLPVEIEYEDRTISQYPLVAVTAAAGALTLTLADKHTDCLAKETCGTGPATTGTEAACCGSGCCA